MFRRRRPLDMLVSYAVTTSSRDQRHQKFELMQMDVIEEMMFRFSTFALCSRAFVTARDSRKTGKLYAPTTAYTNL